MKSESTLNTAPIAAIQGSTCQRVRPNCQADSRRKAAFMSFRDAQIGDLLANAGQGGDDLARGGEIEIFPGVGGATLQRSGIALGTVEINIDGVDHDAGRFGVGAGKTLA